MKKSTLESIRNYLNGDSTIDLTILKKEVNDEWERTTAKSRANTELYASAMPVVEKVLDTTPRTSKEIFALCENELPDGFTANKVQYLILHQLADKVEKHENGKNPLTYTRKM